MKNKNIMGTVKWILLAGIVCGVIALITWSSFSGGFSLFGRNAGEDVYDKSIQKGVY